MFPAQRFLINEIENEERIHNNRLQKRVIRDSSDPYSLPDRRFIDIFRLNKDLVAYLFDNLLPHMDHEVKITRIPRQTRILIALRFFATGNYQRGIGEELLLSASQQAVSRCVGEVSEAIVGHLGHWVKFPQDLATKNQIKAGFMEKAGFPGCLGCIDCTHVAIIAPAIEEHNYVSRKGYHSKNIQIICNYNLEIFNINARYPGSCNDAFIWRASHIWHLLSQEYNRGGRNNWLLGDSGYPLEPWLLTPIENAEPGTPEGEYNLSHKITRSIIEKCNGRLKLVFRCLMGERKLRYNPNKVGTIINACAILHNLCIKGAVQYGIDFDNNVLINVGQEIRNAEPVLNEARQVRQNVVNRYFRNF